MKNIKKSQWKLENVNKKYFKNYQRNTNVEIFLKSNYKYKRRCLTSGDMQQLVKQKHPATFGSRSLQQKCIRIIKNNLPHHSNTNKIACVPYQISMELHEKLNETICIPAADNSDLFNDNRNARPASKEANNNNNNRKNIGSSFNSPDGSVTSSSISSSCHTYKFRNNIDVSLDIAGDDVNYQHDFDRVSTITSMCYQRQKHQPTKVKPKRNTMAPVSTTRSPSPSTSQWPSQRNKNVRNALKNQCLKMLRQYFYHRRHQPHQACNSRSKCDHSISATNVKASQLLGQSASTMAQTTSSSTAPSLLISSEKIDSCCSGGDSSNITTISTKLTCLLTLLIALAFGVHSVTAGACWQTVLDNGKCSEIFSFNISRSECCGANQEFSYTDRELTNVEYFFATAIGGGMECVPCLESCRHVKCGPSKKCVKRKGRPKCICAPECGAERRRRKHEERLIYQQHHHHHHHHNHNLQSHHRQQLNGEHEVFGAPTREYASPTNAYKFLDKSQNSRDTRSLSSEITHFNLGLEEVNEEDEAKDAFAEATHNKDPKQNQRIFIPIHMQMPKKATLQLDRYPRDHHHQLHQHNHQQPHRTKHSKPEEPRGNRRILILANVEEHTEKPSTRRLQVISNVRMTYARRRHGQQKHEDTELYYDDDDDDYYYDDYDDDDDYDGAKRLKSNKHTTKTKNNNGNSTHERDDDDNDDHEDASRSLNRSMSRQTLKTNNKNRNHDLEATKKTKQQPNSDDDDNNNNNNKRHRHSHLQKENDAENLSNHNQQQRMQHHHQQQRQQHHRNHNRQHNANRNDNNRGNGNKKKQKQQQQQRQQQQLQHKQHKNKHQQQQQQQQQRQQHPKPRLNGPKHPKNKNKNYHQNNVHSANSSIAGRVAITAATAAAVLNTSSLSLAISNSTSNTATPANSTVSAAFDSHHDDHDHRHHHHHYYKKQQQQHDRIRNHGSKIPASFPLNDTSAPSTALAQSSLESSSTFATMSGNVEEGEGVLLAPEQPQKHQQQPNHDLRTNNDLNILLSFNSNSNKNQLHQQHQTATQEEPKDFDKNFDQFNLHGLPNHPTMTDADALNIPSNPVCGTDGRTYNTECQLRKRACRTDNPNLVIAYRGHCRTTCNGVKCLKGLTCVEDQYNMPHCIPCKIQCPQDDYNRENSIVDVSQAVCGTDGKTYRSTCDMNRMICKLGRSVGVAYPGPCRDNHVTCDDINCGPKLICLMDLITHKPRCTPCRYKCSRKRRPLNYHFEEGKICAVNNHTYNSWCEMRKDSCSTGFYIEIKYPGECH